RFIQMTSQTSTVRESTSVLFMQKLDMHVEFKGDPSGSQCRKTMKLKIFERMINNENELRAELCSVDYDMVYAGGVTKANFPQLSKRFKLSVNLDRFADGLIHHLKPQNSQPIEIYVILSDDQSKCSFEVRRSASEIVRSQVPLELDALRGEELLTYIKSELREQRKIASVEQSRRKRAEERIGVLEKEEEKNRKLEEWNERLREECKNAKESAEDNKIDLNEWKQKYEAEEQENYELKGTIEDQINEIKGLQDDVHELMDSEDKMKRENEELADEIEDIRVKLMGKKSELDDANYQLKQAKSKIATLTKELKSTARNPAILDKMMEIVKRGEPPVQSCDEKKLKELEEDLKEKNALIDSMTARITNLTKEKEESEAMVRQLRQEAEGRERLIKVYQSTRIHSNSPSYSPGLTAYSTPPSVMTTTPSTARYLSQERVEGVQRGPLLPYNRPLVSPLSRPLHGQTEAAPIPQSPLLSYQNHPRFDVRKN
ncbi:hypothetical protein PMAYCL1PPCAC_17918, partial [Pristionchus mayeri]